MEQVSPEVAEPQKVKPPTTPDDEETSLVQMPRTAKVEIREGENGSEIVATQRTWEEVERFFVQALSNKRGKRFIFEIESSVYTDIYFQGYSEPDLSRTIEAAADLSVRPKLSDKQKLAMSVIGWDLPSEDLPNFIMFLESSESGDRSLAQIFTKTLREGYGLELGTFSVIAPVRQFFPPKYLVYFFFHPAGHFGLVAVTFFVTLPFTQMIDFFGEGFATGSTATFGGSTGSTTGFS